MSILGQTQILRIFYLAAFVLPVDGDAAALGPGGENFGERGESGELLEVDSMLS